MKRLFTFVLVVVMFAASLSVFSGCVAREDRLRILNWADYIDQDLIKDFEAYIKETEGRKIKVDYDTAETNDEMYTKIKTGKADYDLLCPSDYMIEKMVNEDLLIKIDKTMVPNAEKTSPYIKSLYDKYTFTDTTVKLADYLVGYTWGTMGILYRPDKIKSLLSYNDTQVETLVSSWNALWAKSPAGTDLPALNNTITLKNSDRDNYFAGATYLYKNAAQAGRTDEISKVGEALKAQKAVAQRWEVDELKDDIYADNKNISMGLQWAGDAKYAIDAAKEQGVELKYSVPNEGSNVFFDGWVIPVYAKQNGDLAEKFMDFMCDTENAAQSMEEIGYASVIADKDLVKGFEDSSEAEVDVSYFFGEAANTTKLKISPVYYPHKSTLDRCYVMRDFGAAHKDVMDMWLTVKN